MIFTFFLWEQCCFNLLRPAIKMATFNVLGVLLSKYKLMTSVKIKIEIWDTEVLDRFIDLKNDIWVEGVSFVDLGAKVLQKLFAQWSFENARGFISGPVGCRVWHCHHRLQGARELYRQVIIQIKICRASNLPVYFSICRWIRPVYGDGFKSCGTIQLEAFDISAIYGTAMWIGISAVAMGKGNSAAYVSSVDGHALLGDWLENAHI